MEDIIVSDRARQFLPFNSLKGLQAELRKREQVVVAKKELLDEKQADLSYKLSLIQEDQMVKLVYYENGKYLELTGLVTKTDFERHQMTIVKKVISFSDIYEIESVDQQD